ncbi:hypothetical protein E4U55_003624 [Claviceps digitariae]|nr:hypothetical protein E4U55_003624 [Claviceps digitariae]
MSKHLAPREAKEDDQHRNDEPADAPRMAKQFLTSYRESSSLLLVCHGRQFSRQLSLADTERAYVTTSRVDGEPRRSVKWSSDNDTYQGNDDDKDDEEADEEEEEEDGESENYDGHDKDDLPGSFEVANASFSSNLTALNEEWNQSLTNQLYTHHLSDPSQYAARFRAQLRAGEMRYPASLPLQGLRIRRESVEDAKDTP